MSETVDTNVLVYASDEASQFNKAAKDLLKSLSAGPAIVYLFWPVVMGYLRITTHSRIFTKPLTPAEAVRNIEGLLARPHIRTGGENTGFWQEYRSVTDTVLPRGNLVPDAHIVSLMYHYGITTIWTHDSDFRKFEGIKVRSPF
jgi:uncharacterized protein